MRKEDIDDPHKSLDFGMGEGKKRKSGFFSGGKEKESRASDFSSPWMWDISSPYLLPPQMQESRDSLHSLAKSLKKDGDPYGPVDDVSSIRSSRPGLARKKHRWSYRSTQRLVDMGLREMVHSIKALAITPSLTRLLPSPARRWPLLPLAETLSIHGQSPKMRYP